VKVLAGFGAFFLFSSAATAGRITDLFSDGLFGNKWGDEAAQVEAAHPGGKWKQYGKMRQYTVRDGRAVLGVERPKSDLVFALNADGKLAYISIEYPFSVATLSELTSATAENFGPHITSKDERTDIQHDMLAASGYRWPEDQGITVALTTIATGFRSKTILSITKVGVSTPKTADDLGLD
jgi:hypothetical protein